MTAKIPAQVRSGEGVEARDGIDTLIVLLLADLDRAAELEHFCGSPTSVAVDQVEGPLRARERFLPLAALYAGAGHSSQALSIWQVLSQAHPASVPPRFHCLGMIQRDSDAKPRGKMRTGRINPARNCSLCLARHGLAMLGHTSVLSWEILMVSELHVHGRCFPTDESCLAH